MMTLFLVVSAPTAAAQQNTGPTIDYESHKMSETLYVLKGAVGYGPNVGLVIGENYAVIIDGPHREAAKSALLSAIRKVTSLPIRYAILPDGDYFLRERNIFFETIGADIITQENARYGYTNSHIQFNKKMSLHLSNDDLHLYHVTVNSHDDVIVHFPKSNVIFIGNLYDKGGPPAFFVGGVDGVIEAADFISELSDDKTVIIPRIGDPTNSLAIRKDRDNKIALRRRLKALHASGASAKLMVKDKEFLGILEKFTGPEPLTDQRLSRLINRVISTEFVTPYDLSRSAIKSYLGTYEAENGHPMELFTQDGKFFARREGDFLLELIPVADDTFHVRGELGDTVTFLANDNGALHLELSLYGERTKFRKQV